MSDACYTARATTKAQVTASIDGLNFPTTNGQYTHDAAATFVVGLHRVLKMTFNPSEPGCGMEMLLRSSTDGVNPSALSAIRSTDVATIATVIKTSSDAAKKAAEEEGTEPSTEPLITTRADAMDAADRQNQLTQAVIGAKEGATAAITAKVGERVTDAILRTADGTDFKSIDEYELYELVSAVIQAADRPRVRAIRQQLLAALSYRFNLRQRFSDNVAVLRAKNARIAAYGIVVHDDMIANVVLAEADEAAREEWGREIGTAMDKIRLLYGYDFAHDAASLAVILKELAAADAVRTLLDAPAPTHEPTGHANAVEDLSSHVRRLVFDDDSTVGTAAAAGGYNSDSSAESERPSRSRAKKGSKTKDRARSSSRRRDDQTAGNNPCRHCKKAGRRNRHPNVQSDKCFWNKRWAGFRPRYACKQLDIRFATRDKFTAELGGYDTANGGGYASSDGETTSDGE